MLFGEDKKMARDNRSTGRGGTPNRAGRPTGSYGSYGTSGYGYGASGGAPTGRSAGGRSPYGAYGAQPTNANGVSGVPATVEKKEAKTEKDYKGKQKKIAKKAKKFDETDLRCYPMTVGGWIGTFILLAIPLIGSICTICWFFGVGNKSRTAWIRSYVVIVLLIVLLLGVAVGATYGVVSNKAKNVEVEINGVSYGTLGDYGAKGTLYYLASVAVDAFGDELVTQIMGMMGGGSGEGNGEDSEVSGEDGVKMVKEMLAIKILGINTDAAPEEGGPSEGGPQEGGPSESGPSEEVA